jgi:hypothetical protein
MDNQHQQIKGYRELSQAEIDLMNQIKAKAAEVGELCQALAAASAKPGKPIVSGELDGRWVAIGKTHLQEGFMALTRAVAQPTTF